MENSNNSVSSIFSKFMGVLFICIGIFLGFYAFFANAATWTLPGGASWNNNTYLSSTFWSNSPTSGDIIKALYGSGDEGTAYTQNWSGYNSGSCLSAGMTVEFTGVVPTTTVANTIYVINSGTYIITSPINFQNCVSFISSGTVILSVTMGTVPVINSISNTHTIIEKIQVDGNNAPHYGLFINGGSNATVKDFQAYHNVMVMGDAYGVFLSGTSHITLINTQLYNNSNGLGGINSHSVFAQNLHSYTNSLYGVAFTNLNTSTFSGLNIYSNGMGFALHGSSGNQILNTHISGNLFYGISLGASSFNIISGSSLSGNSSNGIQLTANSNSNTITNSTVYGLANSSLLISDSTGNIIHQFLGNRSIDEYNLQGAFQYTIYNAYTQANNYTRLYSSDSATLLGNTLSVGTTFPIYFDELEILQNGSPNYLMLTGVNAFVVGGNTWDGILYAPSQITVGTKLLAVGDLGAAQLITTFFDTMEVVSGTTSLTLYGGTGTLNYQLVGGMPGQYLSILKSNDGNTWSLNTLSTGCILDITLSCTFTTNGNIKLFAFGVPGLYFSGTTQSGTLVSSGGNYNTGVRIIFTGLALSGATLNGTAYVNNTLITADGIYTFLLQDTLGSTTGTTFTIDTTNPTFGGATSGGYYNTGVTITFADLHLSGAIVSGMNHSYYSGNFQSGSTLTGQGIYTFIVNDTFGNSTGMTFTIDTTNPTATGNYPTSGLNITGGNTITFTRSGSDNFMISGYILYIGSTGYTTTGTNIAVTLANGSYNWRVLATDRAGNTGTSTTLPFIITTPLSGNVIITGTNIVYNVNPYSKDYVSLYLLPNQPCNYSITGDIVASITGATLGGFIVNTYLTGTDGAKNIYVRFSNASGEIVSQTITVYLDTITPLPNLTSPINGVTLTEAFNLLWSSVGADAVGLSGYQYYISTTGTFTSLVKSGFVTTTGVSILTTDLPTSGIFYWYVKAVDKLGNLGTSAIQSFIYSGIVDILPDTFSFNSVSNAATNSTYMSNPITIAGLSANTPVLASVNRGVLYISGNSVGTSGYVQNGWTLRIELTSSNTYNTQVTSTLSIGGFSTDFNIMTATSSSTVNDGDIQTNLSNTTKLQIISIFQALRDLYAGDKQTEFLNTLLVMLQSRINSSSDTNQRDALQYLYDLVNQYNGGGGTNNTNIGNTSRIVNGIYTAPNGKKYRITYDSARQQFTSTNFLTPKFFPTLDVLKYTIDINNALGSSYLSAKTIKARWGAIALDGQRQTSPYTAPNRKVFYFFKTIDEQYSSYTFSAERYFDSLEDVKQFIFNTNK